MCSPSLEQNSLETQRGRGLALSPALPPQEVSQRRLTWDIEGTVLTVPRAWVQVSLREWVPQNCNGRSQGHGLASGWGLCVA